MQLIVNITVLAAIYALLACGYVLIYRVSRVMNMAHGELMALAGRPAALDDLTGPGVATLRERITT